MVGASPHSLKHGDNIELLVAMATTQDRATINENGRPIESCNTDQAAWHVLVAATNRYESVKALTADHRLNGVCDDLA